jgi:hypothetical protein
MDSEEEWCIVNLFSNKVAGRRNNLTAKIR